MNVIRPHHLYLFSPEAPGQNQHADEDEEKGHVGEPHDDVHGVVAKNGPRRRDGRRDRRGPAGGTAVLTGARRRTIVQRLGAAKRVVVHEGHARRRSTWRRD